MDDPAELQRRVEYLDTLRAQGRPARVAGFVACLAGVLILIVGRFRLGGAIWALWSGSAIIALGWALFIYAIGRRLYWVRAHPYPNAANALQGPHG